MMKNLVGKIVSVLMEVLMWITLIGCAGCGLGFGWHQHGVIGAVGGLVLGAIAGMLINICWWLLSTFQEIRDYSKKWRGKYKTEPESPDLAQAIDFQKLLAPLAFLAGKRKQVIISLISLALLIGIIGIVKNIDFSQKEKEGESKEAVEEIFSSFVDSRDNRTYKTAKIGDQIWMAENLNFAESGKCYGDDPANCQKYGKHFSWAEAKDACPSGWHLPSNAEWDVLYRFADGNSGTESPYKSETAGKHLKAKDGWNNSGNGEDTYGFATLPGGSFSGSYSHLGNNGYWWSVSEHDGNNAYYRFMLYDNTVAGWNKNTKKLLLSVRCLKN
jgi:uncharacterized protein (TIGR02145 family)